MPTTLAVLLASSAVVALGSPWLRMRRHERGSAAWRTARAHVGASLLMAAVVLSAWQGWSFAGGIANLGAVWLAWIASAFLALTPFYLKPRLLGGAAGILCAGGWLLASLWLALTLLFENNSPAEADLGDGLHCRESVYGFAAGDSGTDLALFRRYGFIDHKVLDLRESDVYPQSNQPAPPAWRAAVLRCHRLVERRRRADAATGAP